MSFVGLQKTMPPVFPDIMVAIGWSSMRVEGSHVLVPKLEVEVLTNQLQNLSRDLREGDLALLALYEAACSYPGGVFRKNRMHQWNARDVGCTAGRKVVASHDRVEHGTHCLRLASA